MGLNSELHPNGCQNSIYLDSDNTFTLPENHQLLPGQSVLIEIDWERRYQLMRLHFAAELILELFYKALPGIKKVGAHIAQNKARIDFEWPESISPLLKGFSDEANRIIESGLTIKTDFDDEENERRYWEIEGLIIVPRHEARY